ncbi:MAG: DUF2341 domain-containing protein, partial [Candidatus Hadarchaeales archaeon]
MTGHRLRILAALLLLVFLHAPPALAWWDTQWWARRPITIIGSHPENYHLKIILPYDDDMRPDFGDIRFVENSDNGELSYWIENYQSGVSATVWVKRRENYDNTIYLYYKNPQATSTSSWENTILPYVDSCATSAAGWSGRYSHTSVVFDNKIWVLGGYASSGYKNDVWYSSDGINWTCATSAASWSARYGHTSVVFDNKIWVLGGYDSSGYKNDVWYSSNGTSWTCATSAASWSARCGHTSVVFDNKIWVLGGFTSGGVLNDVWYSSNGTSWIPATF